jgi:hypothetical protein
MSPDGKKNLLGILKNGGKATGYGAAIAAMWMAISDLKTEVIRTRLEVIEVQTNMKSIIITSDELKEKHREMTASCERNARESRRSIEKINDRIFTLNQYHKPISKP